LSTDPGFAAGKVGQAFSLDGTNGFIQIRDTSRLRPVSLTLEAWVSFDYQHSTPDIRVIIAKPVAQPATGNDSYVMWLQSGKLNGTASDASVMGSFISFDFSPVLGRWYHLAYTFDNDTKQQALYVDGIQVVTGNASKSPGYENNSNSALIPLLLRRDTKNGTPSFFLKGRIDEAAIYNRDRNSVDLQCGACG
jgi:Concanavalin A-like lectin/glucanases superfamily